MERFIRINECECEIGSNGSIKILNHSKVRIKINNCGERLLQYAEHNKIKLKRIPDLVYKYHYNDGEDLPSKTKVYCADKNEMNFSKDNLKLYQKFASCNKIKKSSDKHFISECSISNQNISMNILQGLV